MKKHFQARQRPSGFRDSRDPCELPRSAAPFALRIFSLPNFCPEWSTRSRLRRCARLWAGALAWLRSLEGLRLVMGEGRFEEPGVVRVGGERIRGDRVFHVKFGYGRVTGIEGNKLTVAFDKAGEKKVIDSFVEKG